MTTIPDASQTLFQYGAIGAIAAVLLALFVWSFRLVLLRFLKAWDAIALNLTKVGTDQATHAITVAGQHQQIMLTLHNQHTAEMSQLRDVKEARHRRPSQS